VFLTSVDALGIPSDLRLRSRQFSTFRADLALMRLRYASRLVDLTDGGDGLVLLVSTPFTPAAAALGR
jgi:hypothetical protein